MPPRDPLEALLSKAWDCLEAEDADGARKAHERARRRDPDDAEVVTVGGLLAAMEGDVDRGLAELERAAALDPEYATPLINAADMALYSAGDPEAALALCDRALERVTDEPELIETMLLKIDALTALDDDGDGDRNDDEIRALLGELGACSIDDAGACSRVGDAHLRLGDLAAAERAYRDSLAREELADARYGLGCVHEAREDLTAAVPEWLRCRELDALEPYPPHHIAAAAFQEIAEAALSELPPVAIDKLSNVAILVEDAPSPDLIREGVPPRLLGLFTPADRAFEGQALSVDTVQLFQRNLERVTADPDHLAEEIRITVLHETAHFFGLDEDELRDLGLD